MHLRILLPKACGKGKRRSLQQQHKVLSAIFYVVHIGCQWRELPHDFPVWQTVYKYFRQLCNNGIW